MSNRLQSVAETNVQSLLEKVRQLEMENKRLKEKEASDDKTSIIQRNVRMEVPTRNSQSQSVRLANQILDMGEGVKLTISGEIDKSNQLIISYEVASPSEFDTTIIMSSGGGNDGYGNRTNLDTVVDFLRVTTDQTTRGSKHIVPLSQRGYHTQKTTVSIGLTMIRMAQQKDVSSDNCTAIVVIQNQKISVDVPYVSKWSQFLQAYFTSNMKERANGIYPINDCKLADFREMLEVIYPFSKPIDENNIDAMLDLGDRFIMPMLTRKCEVFLSKNTLHGISEIRMIGMADRFNLIRTRTIVLERLGSTALLRSKIIQAAGYDKLSKEMKREIDSRYVQLDVQEREGNQNRGY